MGDFISVFMTWLMMIKANSDDDNEDVDVDDDDDGNDDDDDYDHDDDDDSFNATESNYHNLMQVREAKLWWWLITSYRVEWAMHFLTTQWSLDFPKSQF